MSLHLGDEDLHARQQPDAVERNNHRVIKVPDDADGGVDSRPTQGGGERQAGIRRSCIAAVDPVWPSRVFRPSAQPQRHLEGVQHQLGALVRGGGSADDHSQVDLHDESGVDDCGPGRPYLKPATWRRLGADTLKSEGCSPLLPGTVVRLGVTAQRPSDGAAVGGSAYKNPVHRTQPYCSSTPRGLRCQSPAATPRTVPGLWGEPDGLILEPWLCRNNQQSAS